VTTPAAALRVLVADDDPQLLRLIARLLERGGFAVASAIDGREALRHFRAEPGSIGVVVLDAAIAPGGAAPLLAEMAQLEPGLGVVFTSGDSLTGEQRALLVEHGGVFLRKPFAPEALLRAVEDSQVREDA
jgi:DNA-binding NtrC family response regulator